MLPASLRRAHQRTHRIKHLYHFVTDDHLALHVDANPQHTVDVGQRRFVDLAVVIQAQPQAGGAMFDMFDILSTANLGDDVQRSLQVVHVLAPVSRAKKKT